MASGRVEYRRSWWILVGFAVLMGTALLRILLPLLLPLLFALAAALVFRPAYDRMVVWFGGARRIASLFATTGIVLIVVLPMVGALLLTGQQMVGLAQRLAVNDRTADGRLRQELESLRATMSDNDYSSWRDGVVEGRSADALPRSARNESTTALLASITQEYSAEVIAEELSRPTPAAILDPENSVWLQKARASLSRYAEEATIERLTRSVSTAASESLSAIYERTTQLLSNAIAAAVGFAVMTVAVYYFLAEGPQLAEATKAMLPLGDFEEAFILHRFDELCRGVIVGTIASALVQGVLMSIGLAIVGSEFTWLLGGLTVVFSMFPFLGAAGVYVPVAAVLAIRGHYGAAAFLLVYGIAIVSTSDNLVRMHALKGKAQLHPLVGLVSMLGGLDYLGLWGIFVGPILAGLFYSVVRLVQAQAPSSDSRSGLATPGEASVEQSGQTGIVVVTK